MKRVRNIEIIVDDQDANLSDDEGSSNESWYELVEYTHIYHFDTSDQRKPQGYISHIALTTERYQVLP